ncbi:hypothetical protein JTB14_028634 [Gonioctena quinquepunctata]|nr:hypothetical protein JTB14_028634 [Gonioctena quinquepunctata]
MNWSKKIHYFRKRLYENFKSKIGMEPRSRNYQFNHEFARAMNANSSFLKLNYFSFGKYNRTAKAANIEFDISMDVNKEKDITILMGFSIFKSNQYRRTPIVIPAKICQIRGTEQFDIPNIMGNSSAGMCPISKGHHYLYNINPTSHGWPRSLPEGRFMGLLMMGAILGPSIEEDFFVLVRRGGEGISSTSSGGGGGGKEMRYKGTMVYHVTGAGLDGVLAADGLIQGLRMAYSLAII